ncbi:hypothetical protein [Halotalea alkalilenta]|uniref:hypothetical protein n=1 Tax=Halotalea alkalilenta TaxID=376489 RepID=UPI0012DE49A6|nr:hypothetical protein [Halotalea alkalilenta]
MIVAKEKNGIHNSATWIPLEQELVVLSIQVHPAQGIFYILWSDYQESVAMFSANDFSIVDNRLSNRWVLSMTEDGGMILSPSAWLENDFWNNYHEEDPVANEIFQREFELMVKEWDGMDLPSSNRKQPPVD